MTTQHGTSNAIVFNQTEENKMKNILILILLALNVACAKRQAVIEPVYSKYVESFIQDTKQQTGMDINTNNLIVKTEEMQREGNVTTLGVCTVSTQGLTIAINKKAFENASETTREVVLFHELAHCLLGMMSHYDSEVDLMNTYINSVVSMYSTQSEELKQKVFQRFLQNRAKVLNQ